MTVASIRSGPGIDRGERQLDRVEPQRMAERDQVAGPLRRHDSGQPGDLEDVPLASRRSRISARVAGSIRTRPLARAVRSVTALPETSTIRLAPWSSKCDSSPMNRPFPGVRSIRSERILQIVDRMTREVRLKFRCEMPDAT